MFVQIMEGRTNDRAALERLGKRWEEELRPGAAGFLGATIGVTDDGRVVNVVRFESEEKGRANSERPEQGAWWNEYEKCFDGEVTFTNSSDATIWGEGGSNDAGFVQVMKSTGVERARVEEFDERLTPYMERRPDLIGGVRVWTGPDSCTELAYFTSEDEARASEATMEDDLREVLAEYGDLMEGVEYLDLRNPVLI